MKIYLGSDHAGFDLKEKIRDFLESEGHDVEDCGDLVYDKSDDYPDYVAMVAQAVAQDPEGSRGVIFGWSGQGEAMVANRFRGVRAALYAGGDEEIIKLSRQHNNANILSLGAHFVDAERAKYLTKLWLETPFEDQERHQRRIEKLDNL